MKFYNTISILSNSDRLALLLPGYTGGSGAFSSILPLLDCDVLSITYPGHGEYYRHFEEVGALDWEQSVIEAVEKASEHYDDVLLIGYSMGGALTLLHGKNYPKLLLAPAIIPKDCIMKDDGNKKPISLDSVNPRLKAMCDEEDLDVICWFLAKDGHRSQIELDNLERKANKITDKVFPHTYAFIGDMDPVIPCEKSYKWLNEHKIEVKRFPESTHAILYDPHYNEVVEEIRKVILKDERLRAFTKLR